MILPDGISERLSSAGGTLWQRNHLLDIPPFMQLFGGLVVLFSAIAWPLAEPLSGPTAILLVLITGWAVFRHGRHLLRSPVAWLFAAALAVQIASWISVQLSHPEWAESSPKMHRLGHWFAFAAIACWLGGSTRNALALWTVALVSLLLTPWVTGGGFAEWTAGAAGKRVDFGIRNAQHTAMLFGTALIGLLVLAPRLFRWARRSAYTLLPVGLLWLAAVIACSLAVLYTQTRAVWLGLTLAVLFLLTAVLWAQFAGFGRRRLRRLVVMSTLILALLVALGGKFGGIVAERLEYEHHAIGLVLAGDIDSVPYTSTGIRVHTWVDALPWIQERPLLGWGGKGRRLVIEHSETMPRQLKDTMGHLHNSYLDLQVNNGLLGSLLLLALIGWLLLASLRAWRQGVLPGDLLLFFLGFMLYWLWINCFESYLFFGSGGYVFGLVCAGVVTHVLRAGYSVKGAESALKGA
ncbi:O-antigen ligase family protein [Microbulbifer thermotolerans]|uniref:O-antigen ligase-related domain-containing protein n=1 Tax=Microbulbifer thermotolerans TaxID=252514 RepID=A0A143HP61_MICTH|nr:O-antigen ligase family protein [Microbulbifer thermotolerans]AMX03525.1 hypothetical protein A3224_13930 [Microbulbifer thermotolerans]